MMIDVSSEKEKASIDSIEICYATNNVYDKPFAETITKEPKGFEEPVINVNGHHTLHDRSTSTSLFVKDIPALINALQLAYKLWKKDDNKRKYVWEEDK